LSKVVKGCQEKKDHCSLPKEEQENEGCQEKKEKIARKKQVSICQRGYLPVCTLIRWRQAAILFGFITNNRCWARNLFGPRFDDFDVVFWIKKKTKDVNETRKKNK
jgi:hypothetical protein